MNDCILVKPHEKYTDELRAYRAESILVDPHIHGGGSLEKFANPLAWIENCRLGESRETLANPDLVTATQYMLVHEPDSKIIGIINLRHTIESNNFLAEYGGHIGYSVRPSERRKGYAKLMLALCLDKCRERGMGKVLITCLSHNKASRKTILALGGVHDRTTHLDGEGDMDRFWITL